MKVFNEVGFDLDNGFMSYELEYDNKEVRYKGWFKGKVLRVYVRIWIGRRVMIISKRGIEVKVKGRFNVKVVIGFEMN